MALDDYPEIYEMFKKLAHEKEAIRKKSQPLRDKYDKLSLEISKLQAEQKELSDKFHAIEKPRLAEIDNHLSRLALATQSGKRLSD